jgi:FtsH-binding integral membrane protein
LVNATTDGVSRLPSRVGDDDGLAAFHDGDDGVGGAQVDADDFAWGSFYFMGLIGIVICSVINIFLHSTALGFAISFIGVFVFLGLTAYDTQKLKAYATSPELRENLAVYGALALYLDFINLFLMLLRLFGGGNRR